MRSVVIPKSALNTEEPDLEALFADAVAEVASQVDDEDFDADYGFQSEWDDEDVEEEDLVRRFQNSNHIRQLDRVCRTKCGRPGPD
jgi:hypothetical protein